MKKLKYILIIILVLITGLYVWFKSMILSPPEIEDQSVLSLEVQQLSDSLSVCGDSWLHQNNGGIYELMISGKPFELGVKNGKLTQELAAKQEEYFIDFIKTLIPSETTLNYLKYFITYFNKDLDEYIHQEYLEEIYGISLFASDEYDFIGDKYHRVLNYHAAHDIGHTIQNMNLVACTAFSVQDELTEDSTIYVGRNLDFSAGDDFAHNKIVVFCKPDQGYQFAYISWGGMMGVLSGMNEHGLTISLNSAKSGIPMSAKSPVCIVSRDVLQHAKNIKEAYQIISEYETFVSESFLVSSATDRKVVVIEKSQEKTAIYESGESKLVLTNHFQSKELAKTKLNIESIEEGCSLYRLKRTHELLDRDSVYNYQKVADILRDKNGLNDASIGIGNESAVNQLICHHSVVFNPEKRLMWVSEFPYQENEFIAYDLNKLFDDDFNFKTNEITVDSLKIEATDFYTRQGVDEIWKYRNRIDSIKNIIIPDESVILGTGYIDQLINKNPDFYYGYYVVGLYYKERGEYKKALNYFNKALELQFPRVVDKEQVKRKIQEVSDILTEN